MADLAKKSSVIYFIVAIVLIVFTGGILMWWITSLNAEAERLSQTVSRIVETSKYTTAPKSAVLDTSTWKTYRNEKYGFEVKYPQSWSFEEDYARAVANISFSGPSLKNPNINETFLIQIYQASGRGLREWVNNYFPRGAQFSVKDTTLNGYPAIIAQPDPSTTILGGFTAVSHNEFIYTLTSDSSNILSTFKFIK